MSHSAFHKRNATTTPQLNITPSPPAQETPTQYVITISPIEEAKQEAELKSYPQSFVENQDSVKKIIPSDSQKSINEETKENMQNHSDAKQEGPFDDPFLMDSLNGLSATKNEEAKNKDMLLSMLKESIAYFEKDSSLPIKQSKENISNQPTTANSLNRSIEFPHPLQKISDNSVGSINDVMYLKNENISLQLKYNELKLANKKLLSDFSKLRLQIEDANQIKNMYDSEIQMLNQRLKDSELRLEHMNELYTREKIEKENNSCAFRSIIEQMAKQRNTSPTREQSQYGERNVDPLNDISQSYISSLDCTNEEQIMAKIRRIETGLADKDKELKSLKAVLKRERMSPPLCSTKNISPMQSTSKLSLNDKAFFLSPTCSVHNLCKGYFKDPAPAAESINQRTSTVAHKPKYSDLKFMPNAKKDENTHKPSPKASPGYDRQPLPKGIMKKTKTIVPVKH